MRKFLRRLLFYCIGLGIGSAGVYFLWIRNRTDLPALWPKGVIKQNIGKSDIVDDSTAACLMRCYQMDEDSVKAAVKGGRVNLSESITRGAEYPTYAIDYPVENDKLRFMIRLEDSLSYLLSIEPLMGNFRTCNCP